MSDPAPTERPVRDPELTPAGHVEKTNDRDYEVEERYVLPEAQHSDSRFDLLTPT